MLELSIWVFFKEHFIDTHVKGGNDFLRVTNKLPVQVSIKRLQVTTVDAQERCLQHMNLWKPDYVIADLDQQKNVFSFPFFFHFCCFLFELGHFVWPSAHLCCKNHYYTQGRFLCIYKNHSHWKLQETLGILLFQKWQILVQQPTVTCSQGNLCRNLSLMKVNLSDCKSMQECRSQGPSRGKNFWLISFWSDASQNWLHFFLPWKQPFSKQKTKGFTTQQRANSNHMIIFYLHVWCHKAIDKMMISKLAQVERAFYGKTEWCLISNDFEGKCDWLKRS